MHDDVLDQILWLFDQFGVETNALSYCIGEKCRERRSIAVNRRGGTLDPEGKGVEVRSRHSLEISSKVRWINAHDPRRDCQ